MALLTAAACARGPRPTAPSAVSRGPVIRVFDTKANRWSTFDAMIASLATADVAFLGEEHDDADTHALEAAALAALGERRHNMILSLEMFERDVQPLLDRYLAGAVTESVFVAGSRPWERYVTDYRPMVETARVHEWPVVAANIPRPIASAVSRRGLAHLDTLGKQERGYAARDNVCPKDDYYTRFAAVMQQDAGGSGHPTAAGSSEMRAMVDRFYEAQCVKDEAMAEAIVGAAGAHGSDAFVLHVNGSFHSDFGLGTAARVKRRVPALRVIVVRAIASPQGMRDPTAEEKRMGDWLVLTRARR